MDHTAHVTTGPNGQLTDLSTVHITANGARIGSAHRIPLAPTWPDWNGADLTTDQQRLIEALAGLGFRIDGPADRTGSGLSYPVYRA